MLRGLDSVSWGWCDQPHVCKCGTICWISHYKAEWIIYPEVLPSQRSPDFKGSGAFLDYQVQLHYSYHWYQIPSWRNDLVNITGLSVRIYSCLEIYLNLCWNFTVHSYNMRPDLHWFSSSSSVSPMGSFWNPFPASATTLSEHTLFSFFFKFLSKTVIRKGPAKMYSHSGKNGW